MEKKEKLVSLITPVYNGGQHISYLLDSVLNQTYSEIEHIIVDDGSTDETKEIVDSYIPKYNKIGKSLKYFYISNSGQAAAINFGLNHINGHFITWPDSDDFYSSKESIYMMVSSLINSQYHIVRTNGEYIEEDRNTVVKCFSDTSKNPFKEDLFEDCLMKNQFWFSPGSSLVTVDALKNVLNNFQIINSRVGQNYQLFLPLFFVYKCKFINKKLYKIVVRSGSHSRKKFNYSKKKKILFDKQRLILEILQNINMPPREREFYSKKIKYRYNKEILKVSKQNKRVLNFIMCKIKHQFYCNGIN